LYLQHLCENDQYQAPAPKKTKRVKKAVKEAIQDEYELTLRNAERTMAKISQSSERPKIKKKSLVKKSAALDRSHDSIKVVNEQPEPQTVHAGSPRPKRMSPTPILEQPEEQFVNKITESSTANEKAKVAASPQSGLNKASAKLQKPAPAEVKKDPIREEKSDTQREVKQF
jgi:hypothetical protein